MAFTSTCRNITLDSSSLNLRAECKKDDGSYRWSNLNLNDCVSFGVDGNIKASTGWYSPNWRLINNGNLVKNVGLVGDSVLKAECAIERGAFFWTYLEWHSSDFNLNDWVRNNNGLLEFVHPKYGSWFPEWAQIAIKLAHQIATLPSDPMQAYMQAEEELMGSIGEGWLEAHEKEWLKGTYPLEDGRLVRRGN